MNLRPASLALLSLCLFAAAAAAQTQTPVAPPPPPAAIVSVSTTATGVRFFAPGAVGTRLEVYDPSGALVFDSKFREGDLHDWPARAAGLADGAYTCVLTTRDLARRFSVRQATVRLRGGEASLVLEESGTAAVAPGGEQAAIGAEGAGAVTLATHDGEAGAITSTSGALTLRTGDILKGTEREHVRVTTEGRVGVGTDQPEATLDVAGAVRARDGVRFADGTTLSAEAGKLTLRDADGVPLPGASAAGTGTQNYVAKWAETGGAGTLTDSAIHDAGGLVGVGTTAPEGTLHLQTPDTTVFKVVSTGSAATGRAVFQMYRGAAANANGWDFGYNTDLGSEDFIIRELTNGAPQARFLLDKGTGNIGIGVAAPTSRLHVAGGVNFAGLRTVPTANFGTTVGTPNVIGGSPTNHVRAGVVGATLSGGGYAHTSPSIDDSPNFVGGNYGTVAGGARNVAGNSNLNTPVSFATVGGGRYNEARGENSTIPGGYFNIAFGQGSFAAGTNAKAYHLGSFVWSSSIPGENEFGSTGERQFLINSSGGVGINTNSPSAQLQVRSTPFDRGNITFHQRAAALFKTATTNGGTDFAAAQDEPALVLARDGVSGQAFANFARFELRRYENSSTSSRTQLNIRLTHGDLGPEADATNTVLSLRSNGNVGINNANPAAALDVTGNIKLLLNGSPGGIHVCYNASGLLSTCSSIAAPETDAAALADTVARQRNQLEQQREQIDQLKARLDALERLLAPGARATGGKP